MSISKLFVKVFDENIFERTQNENSEGTADSDFPGCENAPIEENDQAPNDPENMTLSEQMLMVRNWLHQKLLNIETQYAEDVAVQQQLMQSRIGPENVMFDIDFTSTVRASTDRLSLRSQGSFNTVKANCCVYGGRWMYEVQLHTKGVMQIGWCSNKCTFNDNSGVGDSKNSYGYDGSKQQLWHVSTRKYGDKWQIGDIITVTIDVDNEIIEFFRNGKSMGIAFEKLEKGPGITFYPAASLGYNQGLCANFGNSVFKYPVTGYQQFQAKPIVKIEKINLLMTYLNNLANITARHNITKEFKTKEFSTKKTVYVLFCTQIIEKFAMDSFHYAVIEEAILPSLKNLAYNGNDFNVQAGTSGTTLEAMLSILWNYLEADEAKYLIKKLVNILLNNYTHVHQGLNYDKQKQALGMLIGMCNHVRTRKFLLESKFFKKHTLALFLYQCPPEFDYMQQLIPNSLAWTEGIGGPKYKYLAAGEKINKALEPLYLMQKQLLLNLLINTDADIETASSRKIFLIKCRRYVMDISMDLRPFHSFFFMQSNIQSPIESTVALSFICVFCDVIRTLFEKELSGKAVAINPKYFFDGSFEYQQFDRLGGVLSHLRKVHRSDIVQQLGAERTHEVLDEERTLIHVQDPTVFLLNENVNDVAIVGRTQGGTFTHFVNPRLIPNVEVTPGSLPIELSLHELLDLAILYYYCVGHKYIVKIATVRDEISALNDVLTETKFYRDDVQKKLTALEQHSKICLNDNHTQVFADIKSKFSQRENVFAQRSIELARKQAWYRSVAMNSHRRLILIWLLEKTLSSLNAASKLGSLFSFVPEVYINILPILLDTAMDFSHHDLNLQFDSADSECAINSAADFLGLHSADQRIILASCKDSMLQALGTLTCHKPGVRALEKASKNSQMALVRSLLRPYENRAWGQSNWLLLRFWLGEGFAYRDSRVPSVWQGGNTTVQLGLCRSRARNESHTGLLHNVAPANPSKHFQKVIGSKLNDDEPFATIFLNSVLGQLNWAFSEFILLLQEIQNTANRQENTVFEPKQMKICSMCFELTVSLMRCLEMIISIAPDIFQDASRPNSDLILNRVCQLISQVLSRVTVPPGCFQFVVDMCSSDLNAVTHFPIITAALGILLALMRPEMQKDKDPQKVTRITRAFLTDPSFQFASLEFALGEIQTPVLQQKEIPRGNFDPQQRAHIDPLTNDVRIPTPGTSSKRIRADPPVIKFALSDFPNHVSTSEIDEVRTLIDMLRIKQSLLSEITLPSEDSLCPICCAKPINVVFTPCRHQSCTNCILQHLLNSKLCFFCKASIKTIETYDGNVIYSNTETIEPNLLGQI